eukprot:737994-Rhodomonas_salina.1
MCEGVDGCVTQLALGGPGAPMIPGHHSGRREAKAAGLKEVPNREFGDCGVGKYLAQDLPPVVLPE